LTARASTGVSLVEMVVAMALTVVLAFALGNAYLFAKRQFLLYQQLSRMQETGRYALRLLGREVAMSGFHAGMVLPQEKLGDPPGVGCVNGWSLELAVPLLVVDDFQLGDEGRYSADAVAALDCLDRDSVVARTDIVAVKRSAGGASVSDGELSSGLTVSQTRRWYLQVIAGERASWQWLSGSELRALAVGPDTSYWRAMSSLFFIRSYSVREEDEIPSLCLDGMAGMVMVVRCVAEGVEDLQLQFGFDTDGDGIANRYLDSPDGGHVSTVVSARIFLLLRSIDPVQGYRGSAVYALGNKVHEPAADGYVRQVVTATVALDAQLRPLG